MVTILAQATHATESDQCVVMRRVGWKGYCAVLRARGERSSPKIVYLDGDLHFMSPGFAHEHLRERLGQFVTEVVVGLEIPCTPAGQTTFRRRKADGGVEGDQTYFLANESRIRGKTKLHLKTDPPPDLVIEAVNTHEADDALEVWRRFGVPEVWVCDNNSLSILHLGLEQQYRSSDLSLAFPFLSATEIHAWVTRAFDGPESSWVRELRIWVSGSLRQRLEPGAS